MFVVDNCFRRLCGKCGGVDAIPPVPPKSKFAGHKMDATTIEDARPKASLMLKRLRANAGTRTGAAQNKYRMRSDEEMESIMSGYSDEASGGDSGVLNLSNVEEGVEGEEEEGEEGEEGEVMGEEDGSMHYYKMYFIFFRHIEICKNKLKYFLFF
jgi:hypothetical protein